MLIREALQYLTSKWISNELAALDKATDRLHRVGENDSGEQNKIENQYFRLSSQSILRRIVPEEIAAAV